MSLKIFLGQTGAGKTYCAAKDVRTYLASTENENVYIVNGEEIFVKANRKKKEWDYLIGSKSIKHISINELSLLPPDEKYMVVIESMHFIKIEEILHYIKDIIKLSHKSPVVLITQQFFPEYKELFEHAETIYYMRMHHSYIKRLPISRDTDKKDLERLCVQDLNYRFAMVFENGKRKEPILFLNN